MSGWRRALERLLDDVDVGQAGIDGHELVVMCAERLLAMPTPDRLALAREMLAGTGWVVAREVNESGSDNGVRIPDAPDWATTGSERGSWEMGWSEGWNACRAAMLGDKP